MEKAAPDKQNDPPRAQEPAKSRITAGAGPCKFTTLGSMIIDDIYYHDTTKSPDFDALGGAGTFAAVGARLFLSTNDAQSVGMIVHEGADFPTIVRDEINSWGLSAQYIATPERNTTRGKNFYTQDNVREFKFVVPNVRIDESMLNSCQLASRVFHFIATPERCIALVKGITEARSKLANDEDADYREAVNRRPLFVWEPMEDSCKLERLDDFLMAMKCVDVFSPNDQEFAQLCGTRNILGKPQMAHSQLEESCKELWSKDSREKPSALVIRQGPVGCFVSTPQRVFAIPAYHETSERVKDTTGGGNAFLGGFCHGLFQRPVLENLTVWENAAIFGSVAASFAIEQLGMPKITKTDSDACCSWNEENPMARVAKLAQRITAIDSQEDSLGTSRV